MGGDALMEFRCGPHVVRLVLNKNGAYDVEVTVRRDVSGNNTYVEATVMDKTLAVHCFNHTVQQYQREVL